MKSLFSTTSFSLLTLVLAVCFFSAPIDHTGSLKKAEAQILVYDIENTLTNTIQTLSTVALEQKEIVWDALFYNIAQQALSQMTSDILSWVNSGFEGDPAFITDFGQFMQDIADRVAGEFLYGDELNTICEVTQLDARIEAVTRYQKQQPESFKDEVACTLDQYGNEEAFLSGNFNAGGWAMWFEATLNPEQTPIGAVLAIESQTKERIEEEQKEKEKQTDWADGFLSMEVCTGEGLNRECTITTPGSIIRDLTSFQLTVPARSLLAADEMNEIIGALFNNLAQQAISGVNGLLGLGGNASFTDSSFGASVNLSYLDALQAEGVTKNTSTDVGSKIDQAFQTEKEVLELQLAIVTEIDAITEAYETAHEPYEGDSCWDLELPNTLSSKLTELLAEVPLTLSALQSLQSLSEAYEGAASPAQQVPILQELSRMQSEGLLSGKTAAIQYEFYINSELKPMIETFAEEIEDQEASC